MGAPAQTVLVVSRGRFWSRCHRRRITNYERMESVDIGWLTCTSASVDLVLWRATSAKTPIKSFTWVLVIIVYSILKTQKEDPPRPRS